MQPDGRISKLSKAGAFGYFTCFVFGVLTILVSFLAAYFWSDGDRVLSAAIGVGSIVIPVVFGFVAAELKHQRAGAIAFVVAAGLFCGAVGAFAAQERDAYEDRRLVVPDLPEDAASIATSIPKQ
jgi:cellobiose-specific phosphotransferase system component IIC